MRRVLCPGGQTRRPGTPRCSWPLLHATTARCASLLLSQPPAPLPAWSRPTRLSPTQPTGRCAAPRARSPSTRRCSGRGPRSSAADPHSAKAPSAPLHAVPLAARCPLLLRRLLWGATSAGFLHTLSPINLIPWTPRPRTRPPPPKHRTLTRPLTPHPRPQLGFGAEALQAAWLDNHEDSLWWGDSVLLSGDDAYGMLRARPGAALPHEPSTVEPAAPRARRRRPPRGPGRGMSGAVPREPLRWCSVSAGEKI